MLLAFQHEQTNVNKNWLGNDSGANNLKTGTWKHGTCPTLMKPFTPAMA